MPDSGSRPLDAGNLAQKLIDVDGRDNIGDDRKPRRT
jgi:hypothetical protein